LKLPAIFNEVPRILIVLAVPIIVFIVTVTLSLGTGSEGSPPVAAVVPTVGVTVAPMPTPTAAPQPTPLVNRNNCEAIAGTAYLSIDERDWYQTNCRPVASTTTTTTSAQAVVQPAASAAAAASGAIYGSGDRLVLERLSINAPVNYRTVVQDGTGNLPLGDPAGPYDVVWYDFSMWSGLGGYPGEGGNAVIAGHVDYRTVGAAVFYNLRQVQEGDIISYHRADGIVVQYSVVWYTDITPGSDWNSLVAYGSGDSITLITCNGDFDFALREYSHRRIVRAVRIS
jgi:LPXTG-site transpeptidase (sortase) family protein